jgi:putative DNA primase/helicase
MTIKYIDGKGQEGSLMNETQEAQASSKFQAPSSKEERARGNLRSLGSFGTADARPPEIHIRHWHDLGIEEVEPWGERVDGGTLMDELRDVMKGSVVLPMFAAETLALWVLHTYAFELRDVTAYLGISSPEKRCGKTTLLDVLGMLVNRPLPAANISPPALFRVIEEARPTLLIDEADTFLHGNDEMRGILNAGYTRKRAFVLRVGNQIKNYELRMQNEEEEEERRDASATVGGGSGLRRYSCWCPKAIASIGRLPETLMDRCIVINLHRKRADERVEKLSEEVARVLRRRCARFVRDQAEWITSHRPEIPSGLNDRAADIWSPLLTLADLGGAEWPHLARHVSVNLAVAEDGSTPIGALLADVMLSFLSAKANRRLSRELLADLKKLRDRPWRDGRKAKEIDELWLARQLRPYGVRPRMIWIGTVSGRGYEYRDLEPIFNRYITRAEVEALQEMVGGETGVQPPRPGFGPAETEFEIRTDENEKGSIWAPRWEEETG